MVCQSCHGRIKCMTIGHLYLKKGPCEICKKEVECVSCKPVEKDSPQKALIRAYRNTKRVEYGGGFLE
jgi:hypothetical protein